MSTFVTLGGVARELRYPWKSIKRLKTECGINLLKGEEGFDAEDPETITAFLWAGRIWETPELTRAEVDEWITLGTLGVLSESIGAAMSAAIQGDPAPNP